jgi:eukaryotic-like serine/threonine-protein kinase
LDRKVVAIRTPVFGARKPVNNPSRSDFERCAMASGLVTREQLDEAAAACSTAAHGPDVQPIDGRQLADALIANGILNAWQAKQLFEGQTQFSLGPYRILDWLGQGGMGQVFRAEHGVLRRQVAVKVLPRDRSTPDAIASFTREIRAQASLKHDNLVEALDAGHDRSVYYLVSEFVPGCNLSKLVRRRGPLDMSTAASVISQVALGLQHAHEMGLVHRDVKPGNVLVTPDGHAKLSDLGLAGPLYGDIETDPRFGKIVGTADYLSPDYIKDPCDPTPAWDIYSLGCTLYYAVTGQVPFLGGTATEKARAHCELRPIDPRHVNPTLSVEFIDVMADMLAKDPRERIPSAAEVVARLAPWVGPIAPIPETIYPPGELFQDDPDSDTVPGANNIGWTGNLSNVGTRRLGPVPASLSDANDAHDFAVEVRPARPLAFGPVSAWLLLLVLLSLAAAALAAWLLGLVPW